MLSLVLEEKGKLSLRDFPVKEVLGPRDVRIKMRKVGICGSDVHYYTHGYIGPFVVRAPMILGHEGAGEVIEIGSEVKTLKVGDEVCMEPGVPNPHSHELMIGRYNLDPEISFWATPPFHGCLRPEVIHPEMFTFKLPKGVSLEEGAMVEPVAVGMMAATRAQITPGDIALVYGAGPIGLVTAMCAIAGGCSKVIISDIQQPKLDIAKSFNGFIPVNSAKEDLAKIVLAETRNRGVDIVFECSGNEKVASQVVSPLRPGGTIVHVGIPLENVAWDIAAAIVKEARIEHVFRYAHVYPKALDLMASGKLQVKKLITHHFNFSDSVAAFEFAKNMPADGVKVHIDMDK
jgi:D-xylulose reductase